jgi:SulP family sulfate permease
MFFGFLNGVAASPAPMQFLRAFTPKSIICLRGYSMRAFVKDLIAGITVGVVALPLAMAFGIASGVSPERGLVTAIIAGFLVSALGGSRVQIGGPTGAFVVLVASIYARFGLDGLTVCTFLAGFIVLGMGLARFGAMIKFIPFPVVAGFTAGIAVVIFSSQIKDLLGLQMGAVPAEFFAKWGAYADHLRDVNPAAAGIGIGTILLIAGLRRIAPRVPGMIVALIFATAAAALLRLNVETIGSRFGDLPTHLPKPALPHMELSMVRELIPSAFTVALLAAIESLLSATVADGMIGTRHKSNMELVAQGIANIGSAMFGGIPATGAIARTATNIKSGGRTPVAGMIHALTLLLSLFTCAPLARLIPLSCLAGILAVVAWNMSEIDRFRNLLRSPRSDVAVLLTTFILTVVVNLTVAVQVGVVLAAMLFIRRMAEITNVGVVTRELRDGEEAAATDPNAIWLRDIPAGVQVYEINGPFFFGAADAFQETMRQVAKPPRVLILRMRNVPAIDATGLFVLEEFHKRCRRDGTHLLLADVHTQPLTALMRSHLYEQLGEENVTGHIDDALGRARDLLKLPQPHRTPLRVPTVAREK